MKNQSKTTNSASEIVNHEKNTENHEFGIGNHKNHEKSVNLLIKFLIFCSSKILASTISM